MKKTIVIVYDGAVINGGAAKIAIQSAVELAKNPDINMIYFAANVVLLPFVKQRLRKEKGFADFVENYIPHTEKVVNVEQLKALVDREQYRAIITGSDQVWNPHIFDFDEMFFFPFETKAIKIGYSVSIGESSLEDIRGYSKYAKDFPYVGLREKGAKEKVEAICGHSVVDTVDPVLLLTREDWETFVDKSSPLAKEKYLFCYLIDKKPIKQNMAIAEQIAKERGLKIKYIWMHLEKESFRGNFINDASPVEFLNYMYSNSSMILAPLCLWFVLSVVNNFLGIQILVASGHQKEYSNAFLISAVMSIVLYFILGKLLGMFGIAFATFFAELALTILLLIRVIKI